MFRSSDLEWSFEKDFQKTHKLSFFKSLIFSWKQEPKWISATDLHLIELVLHTHSVNFKNTEYQILVLIWGFGRTKLDLILRDYLKTIYAAHWLIGCLKQGFEYLSRYQLVTTKEGIT